MSQSTHPRWIRRIVLPLLILLAFVSGTLTFVNVVAARTTAANTSTSPAQPFNGPAPTQENATYETQFMVQMMDHHFLAAQMAQVCLKKASHQQLLTLCHTIISSQEQQISEMQSWLAAWYGVHHSPQLPTTGPDMVRDISSYSGQDFETDIHA